MTTPLLPQREHFKCAELLSPEWELRKGQKRATCDVWSDQFGFELRLAVSRELVQSQVCRTQEAMIETQERWRAGLEMKG